MIGCSLTVSCLRFLPTYLLLRNLFKLEIFFFCKLIFYSYELGIHRRTVFSQISSWIIGLLHGRFAAISTGKNSRAQGCPGIRSIISPNMPCREILTVSLSHLASSGASAGVHAQRPNRLQSRPDCRPFTGQATQPRQISHLRNPRYAANLSLTAAAPVLQIKFFAVTVSLF